MLRLDGGRTGTRGMGIAAFHEFGRKVDYEAFAEQQSEVQSDTVLALGRSR